VGVLSIILGLALLGVLADVIVENDLTNAAHDPLTIVGTTQSVSAPVIAIIAFAAGAFAVVLIVLGIRRIRHAGHKQLEERIRALQDENARLHTQRNLENLVRIPEAEPIEPEPVVEIRNEPDPAVETRSEGSASNGTVADARPDQVSETRPDQPASKW
jgi:hypothetical protein